MTHDELIKIVEPYEWSFFEVDDYGMRVIEKVEFRMRIGLYLSRPVQALMAEGQFLRIRSANQFKNYELAVLDPSDRQINHCIYTPVKRVLRRGFHPPRWMPSHLHFIEWNVGYFIQSNKFITNIATP